MNGYIYKITNKVNNKIYVGMSCNPQNRWKYGHILTAESKLKNSLSHKGRKKMSHISIYPKYKMIPMHEIEDYMSQGWYLTKSN